MTTLFASSSPSLTSLVITPGFDPLVHSALISSLPLANKIPSLTLHGPMPGGIGAELGPILSTFSSLTRLKFTVCTWDEFAEVDTLLAPFVPPMKALRLDLLCRTTEAGPGRHPLSERIMTKRSYEGLEEVAVPESRARVEAAEGGEFLGCCSERGVRVTFG